MRIDTPCHSRFTCDNDFEAGVVIQKALAKPPDGLREMITVGKDVAMNDTSPAGALAMKRPVWKLFPGQDMRSSFFRPAAEDDLKDKAGA